MVISVCHFRRPKHIAREVTTLSGKKREECQENPNTLLEDTSVIWRVLRLVMHLQQPFAQSVLHKLGAMLQP